MGHGDGYGFAPSDAHALWAALIGDREGGDAMPRFVWLSSRGALLAEVARLVSEERSLIAARWSGDGDSYATIAARTGLTRSRVQQLVQRGWRGLKPPG